MSENRKPDDPFRVLVVDDSRIERLLITKHLTTLGYQVSEADNGEAAAAQIAAGGADIVLSDWMMPGMSGLDLCRAARRIGDQGYVYFILMTSRQERDAVTQGLDAGADDFITKPADRDELVARLAAGRRLLALHRRLHEQQRETAGAYETIKRLYGQIQTDLTTAAALQREHLPAPTAEVNGMRVAALCRYKHHVGGDLVGYFPVGRRALAAYSIDVSGHGVASSLLAIQLAQAFAPDDPERSIAFERRRFGAPTARSPREVLQDLNTRYLSSEDHDVYFTMAYALVDVPSGQVSLCQAGHWPAAIQSPNGSVRFIEGAAAPPVGLIDGAEFPVSHLTLARGERLLMYSDGITEAPWDGPDGMLGLEGLSSVLEALAGEETATLLPSIMASMAAGDSDRAPHDDVSIIALERVAQGGLALAG
ncbi:MAG: fused response regulator/phosphatase [Pseudomonadota bacterium]